MKNQNIGDNKKGICHELPKEEKVKRIEEIVIQSPLFKKIIEKITECHQMSKYTAEPICLLVTGETGHGKTTISKFYAKDFPRVVCNDGTTIPVLLSSIASPASVKSMASELLNDLGDPLPDSGTIPSLTRRLCKLIKECKVELIILDEFQHLIDRDTEKVLKSAADWLKTILNKTGVPIILLGMPWSIRILWANEQLKRRFSTRIDLKPFGWSSPEERKEFVTFLSILEKALQLPQSSNLYLGEMPFRLFCATRGIISRIMKLISKAAEKALEKGAHNINMDLLALAYEEELALDSTDNINPFLVDKENLKIPLKVAPSKPAGPEVGKRGRRKSNASRENISSVLCA